jgi:hypothetical protein
LITAKAGAGSCIYGVFPEPLIVFYQMQKQEVTAMPEADAFQAENFNSKYERTVLVNKMWLGGSVLPLNTKSRKEYTGPSFSRNYIQKRRLSTLHNSA